MNELLPFRRAAFSFQDSDDRKVSLDQVTFERIGKLAWVDAFCQVSVPLQLEELFLPVAMALVIFHSTRLRLRQNCRETNTERSEVPNLISSPSVLLPNFNSYRDAETLASDISGIACLPFLKLSPMVSRWLWLCGCVIADGLQLWAHAPIDYSAATDYVEAHYGIVNYFGVRGRIVEPIFNAREGVGNGGASLEGCGFQLIEWVGWDEELLRSRIASCLPGRVSDVILWHPQYRSERPREGQASIATSAHIDTDLNAMFMDDLLRLVERNCVSEPCVDWRELREELVAGRRFAVINAWRNARPEPITRAPLALLATTPESDRFPIGAPDLDRNRWFTFPGMTFDECLLFKQYDRSLACTSDVWHCALASLSDLNAPPRLSFEVRAFVIFEEYVHETVDRFEKRVLPRLSYSQSACFCGDQARRRAKNTRPGQNKV